MHTQNLSRAYLRTTPWHALPALAGNAPPTPSLTRADLRRIVAAMID